MKSALCRSVISALIGLLSLAPSVVAAATVEPVQIEIKNFAFVPNEITIVPGTRVVWLNHDESPHSVAGEKREFASNALDTDDRFGFVFDREGDYTYFCTLHPQMTGIVHVVGGR
jgi:plastocyanin